MYANQIFLEEINVDKNPVSTTQGGRPVFGTHQPGVVSGNNNTIALPNYLHPSSSRPCS